MADAPELGPDPNAVRRHVKKLYSDREYNLRYNRIDHLKPAAQQLAPINAEPHLSQVRILAGSQTGKSLASMAGEAMDSTADYQPWHTGKKFLDKQVIQRPHEYMSWIITSSHQTQKQTLQLTLLGDIDDPNGLGSGMLRLDSLIGRPVIVRGLQSVVETQTVRRTTGGTGQIGFRVMTQDLSSFAGASLDQVRWDEPGDIVRFREACTRLTAVKGSRVVYSATPTEGKDQLYLHFEEPAPYRATFRMNLYDVSHMSKEQIAAIVATIPEKDRPMRIYGEPAIGSGNVYQVNERDLITDRPMEDFNQVWMMLGWALDPTHGGTKSASAFAALLMAYEAHTDTIWVLDEIRMENALFPLQAAAIRQHPYGSAVALWPRDAQQTEGMSGQAVHAQLKTLGVNMASSWVRNSRGVAPGLEEGIAEVSTRMALGKLKISRRCVRLLDEIRGYHRKDGKVVSDYCDLCDALRVGVTGYKQFRVLSSRGDNNSSAPRIAHGVDDWDVFTGRAYAVGDA